MREISRILDEVRKKIANLRDKGTSLNEEDTKAALIKPVLVALGWDDENPEEVSHEYRRTPQDNPADYALLLSGTAKFIIEAKALSEHLHGHKWAAEIMTYAVEAGVKWAVLTNGDEYQVYNACVALPFDEKLFRAVRLTDPNSPTENTLALLSKEPSDDIETQWKRHLADRQIRAASSASSHQGDPDHLLPLVRKHVKDLPLKEIQESLARVRAQFSFPVETVATCDAGGDREEQTVRPTKSSEKEPRGFHGFHGQDGLPEATKSLSFVCEGNNAKATGKVVNDPATGEVVLCVCKGSTANLETAKTLHDEAKRTREELLKQGILVRRSDSYEFTDNYFSPTPSLAAAVVLGRRVSGWDEWIAEDGRPLQQFRQSGGGEQSDRADS